ncbi:MAG: transporter substrate-binding domain-containing protein [Desulfobacterium sp.]|nr:transporter substrate-binding domain-containing protein [Desulfobacterium sp.]
MKIILSITIFVFFVQTSSFAEPVLTFGRPHDPIAEFSSQMLVKAYTRIGYELNFVDLPAARSLMKSNNGSLDGEVNRIKGIEKEYDNLIMVPVPVNFFESVVFTKRHDFRVEGWASLKSFSIAIRIGAKFAEYRTAGMNVVKFSTYEKIFLLLYNDRYDICVSSRITGLYQIKKQNLIGIKALDPPLETINLYHYLHQKHKAMIPKISKVLQSMEQEGIIHKERALFVSKLLE